MSTTMENAPGTCGMIFPRHPDDERRPAQDDPCLRPAIGTTEDGGRVCEECALDMESEGFRVDRDQPAAVTGETITDEQIREQCPQPGTLLYQEASIALLPSTAPERRAEARAFCATAWNARPADLAEERAPDEAKAVREIGERIGYGRIMQLAEKLWREKLIEQGHPGGEHTTGPCAAFMLPCPCPESGRDAAGHCEWCSGTRRVTQRVRTAILAFDLTDAGIDAVYQLALARGDRALLGDVNMARQGEPGARERVAAAYDASRGGERP